VQSRGHPACALHHRQWSMGAENSKCGVGGCWELTDCCGARKDGFLPPRVPPHRSPYRRAPQTASEGLFFQRATSSPGQIQRVASDGLKAPADTQSGYALWRRSPIHTRLHVMREPLSSNVFRLHAATRERDLQSVERLLAAAGMCARLSD